METTPHIKEISAEMLLGYLYPELEDKWLARCDGTFRRNYSDDVLSLDPESKEAILSRDGFLRLLPEGILNSEDELRGKDKAAGNEALAGRRRILQEAALPIDSFYFRRKLMVERQVAALLEDKYDIILEKLFGIRITEDTDKYIRKAAYLLFGIRNLRGNMAMIRSIMETVLECPVLMTCGRYSGTDNTVSWLPMVRYTLIVPALDAEGYSKKEQEIRPFCNFLLEWFIPVDVKCIFSIRQSKCSCHAPESLVLDYNIDLE